MYFGGRMISHRERIENAINNIKNDRPPVALWRHFPVDDQNPDSLAQATLNFQNLFDFDFIKISPASSYCLKDWGVEDIWEGDSEGTRRYTNRVIKDPQDWHKLRLLEPTLGKLGDQIDCIKLITGKTKGHTPVVTTIFNPLSQAKNLVGSEKLIIHMRQYPEALLEGLETITLSTIRFLESILYSGLSGIFYAIQHAQYGLLTPEEYDQFGTQFDLRILELTKQLWFNILHLHGNAVMFKKFMDYPVQVINWHDQEVAPDLETGQRMFSGVTCGGLKRIETIVLGTPEMILSEAKDAIQDTGGTRFILGTGCVTPIIAPFGNLLAVRKSVDLL
jgi:uroporphyrinogen decarboxylase